MSQPTVQDKHTTTNRGGKGEDHVLLRVTYGRGDCGVESKKEEGHTTTNRRGVGGDHVFLPVESEMDEGHTTTNRGGKGRDCVLLRLAAEMDKETTAPSPKRRRDTQQPTGNAREETAYSYASRLRRMCRPQCQVG